MFKDKHKFKIANSMVFALCVAVLMNVLCIALILFSVRYATIEPRIYSIFIGVVVALILLLNILLLFGYGKPILWMRKAFVVVGTLFIIVSGIATYYIYRINTGFDSLVDTSDVEIVNYSVITLDDTLVDGVITGDHTIGYVTGDADFNELLAEKLAGISGNAKTVEYESYASLFKAYLSDPSTVDMAVVPSQYSRLAENLDAFLQERLNDSVVMSNFTVSVSAQTADVKVLEEPFTILIMGINDNLADSIILATVNPKTLSVTMTSLARDSRVPIACYANNGLDKLNHAHGRSRQCLIDTVEDYMDTEVDFYFEADFYALVKIVDALGGLELTSPITFTGTMPIENSNQYKDVTVTEGTYVMTGEQVLTFARERHHFAAGDFERQLNQQYVIKELIYAIINKAKTNPNILVDVLDVAKENIVMNLSMEQDIAPLLGLILNTISSSSVDMATSFTINQTQIVGDTPTIGGVSYITPYKGSVLEARSLIKQVLGTETVDPKTTLSFSINDPYQGYVFKRYAYADTGLMYTSSGDYENTDDTSNQETPSPSTPEVTAPPTVSFTMPDLNEYASLSAIQAWASENGISLSVNTITEDSEYYKDVYEDGQVIYQSVDPGTYEKTPSSVQISIVSITKSTDE